MASDPENKHPAADAATDDGDSLEEAFFAGDPVDDGEAELDPELMQLPRRKRRRRHPLVSVLVMALSLYLIWFLRSDILLFFQPRTPDDVGHVKDALAAGKLVANAFVTVDGAPDRKHAVLLEGRFGGYDNFFRLHQSRNRVYVQRHRDSRVTDKEVESVHRGQLVRFDTLPYADTLRRYLSKTMSTAHDMDFAAIKPSLGKRGKVSVKDRAGEVVTMTPDTDVWVNVAWPEEWIVQFSKKVYTDEKSAVGMLSQQGLAFARDPEPSRLFWRYVVLAGPDQAKTLMAAYRDRKLHAGVVRRQLSFTAKWDQLRAEGDALIIDARDPSFPGRFVKDGDSLKTVRDTPVKVPARAILFITSASAFSIPADALVLMAGRSPGDSWHYALLFAVLLVFFATNAVLLVRRLRERKNKTAS